MEWENDLKEKFMQINGNDFDEIYRLCSNAYSEGCETEKALAIEAYRLRCSNLFGNRCMSYTHSKPYTQKICVGDCSYVKRFKFELQKLEN